MNLTHDEKRGLWLAILAVVCFSLSPVLLIWADPLSPYEKTVGRTWVACLVVGLLAVVQGRPPRFTRSDGPKFLLFGLVTAVHLVTYIAALSFTSMAHALTLTYTSPVFVTLFSALLLKEPMRPRAYMGIAIVVIGIGVMVGFEPAIDGRILIGDGLALISAISLGLYSIIGRSQRRAYPLLTYAFATYGVAGLWSFPAAFLTFTPGGYGLRQILAIIASGIIPSAIGHTLYNAAVRRVHATYANLIATQEVTGGVILGVLLLGQLPTTNSIVGALITLTGIGLVLISG